MDQGKENQAPDPPSSASWGVEASEGNLHVQQGPSTETFTRIQAPALGSGFACLTHARLCPSLIPLWPAGHSVPSIALIDMGDQHVSPVSTEAG